MGKTVIYQNAYMFDERILDNICLYEDFSKEELQSVNTIICFPNRERKKLLEEQMLLYAITNLSAVLKYQKKPVHRQENFTHKYELSNQLNTAYNSSMRTISRNVSGRFSSNTSFAHINVTSSFVSDRFTRRCVHPGII